MKQQRCKFCRRTHSRMVPIRNQFFPSRIDGWKCASPIRCIQRMENIGKWEGKRVLRRFDGDGTEWTIRRWDDLGLRGMTSGPWSSGYVLICEYRNYRLTTQHESIAAAQAHTEDLIASFYARGIEAYRDEPQPIPDDQLELA